jgi:hypothetical protein
MGKNAFVITGLRRKYAELKGELLTLPTLPFQESEDCITALRQVGVVLRMFAPNEDLTAIKPKRPYRPHRRSWSRTAVDMLRRAGTPLTARELARRIMVAEGLPMSEVSTIECSLHATLGRMEGNGLVRAPGEPKRWSVSG